MEGIRNHNFGRLENFKSAQQVERAQKDESKKVEISPNDPYMKWPLRGMAYTNEIGEIIRPMSGMLANLLWLPAIGYIAADVGDKYRNNSQGEQDPSKKRATKQLSFQMLASVILPTVAVKAGQKLTNVLSSKGKLGVSINDRERITDMITESMNKGSHEKFADEAGKIDRTKYSEHIMQNISEKIKHKKTQKEMQNPLEKVLSYLKKPFETEAKSENIQKYVEKTVNEAMDLREALLSDQKPKNVSEKLYKAFKNAAKDGSLEQKKSAAFNVIKKTQTNKLFKNRALKSLGGLVALATMMKPIDNFVEHVLIKRYISPTIDWVSNKPWKPLPEVVKDKEQAA